MHHLTQYFSSPLHEYRPIAWWMLNGDLKPDILRQQLKQFKEYGFAGFATYPYRGLTVPYHSEQWWQAMRVILQTSKELGLEAWILDEFNWPSGHCAGYILRDQPWLRSHPLQCKTVDVEPEQEIILPVDGEVISVVLTCGDELHFIEDWQLENLPEETRIHWKYHSRPVGRLHVIQRVPQRFTYYFAHGSPWSIEKAGWGNLDILNPDAVRAHLRYTMEQYSLRFPEYFGGTVKGFFTDENVLAQFDNFPYTRAVEEEFRHRYGYDLRPRIHELFIDTGKFLQLRYDYWQIIAQWVGSNYYQPYRQWCDNQQVALIGHLCGEEDVRANVLLNGDMFEAGRHLTHPGVDTLYGVTGYDSKSKWQIPGNHYANSDIRSFHLTMKLAQSTAKHTGVKRVFNEAFTCEDYSTSPQSIKRACNYYAAMGSSQLCLADFNYSHAGLRKRRGGSKCFGTPWNRFYPQLTDYIARLSAFAATGTPKAEIGILYPCTTVWTHHNDPQLISAINDTLYRLTDHLVRSHWAFDFVYEQLLEEAKVEKGVLLLPSEQYRVLIAPACKVLPKNIFKKLQAFTESGGILLVIPPFAQESPDDIDLSKINCRVVEDLSACDATLKKCLDKPLTLEGPDASDMVVSYRKVAGKNLFLLANMSDQNQKLKIISVFPGPWELWDPQTGNRFNLPAGKMELDFSPAQALILAETKSAGDPLPEYRGNTGEKLVSLPGPWRFSIEGNVKNTFRLDPEISVDPSGETWEPLVRHVSTKDLDAKYRPAYRLKATFDVELKYLPDDLELVVDSDLVTGVFVNGVTVTQSRPTTLWHHENRTFPICQQVHQGLNTVILQCRTESLNLERINDVPATPIVLTGSFAVNNNTLTPLPDSITPGPWPEKGFPHLAGRGVYETEFDCPAENAGQVYLDLGKVRDAAEVSINGASLGCRIWEPYRFNLTPALQKGKNTLHITITSGIANLLPFGYTDQLVETPIPYGLLEIPFLIPGHF
jgi:hypothetical protein